MPETHHITPKSGENLPMSVTLDPEVEIRNLARRYRDANGLLLQMFTFVGGQIEDVLKRLPKRTQERIHNTTYKALEAAYRAAKGSHKTRFAGDRSHRITAAAFGALGGLGGLPSALSELPFSTTLMLRSIQEIACEYGEDITHEEMQLACLQVMSAAGPLAEDDGADFVFLGARVAMTGTAVNALLSTVAPRFAAVLAQKLGTKTVPVVGSLAGAGTNMAFMRYYQEMAHVHFGLRRLVRQGAPDTLSAFRAEVENARVSHWS